MTRAIAANAEHDEVLREAAQWCLELSGAEVSARRIEQWQQWLAASEAHREAFDRVQSTWDAIDRCADASVPWPTDDEVARDTYDACVPVSVWRAHLSQSSAQRGHRRARAWAHAPWLRRRWVVASLAAGAIAAFAALLVLPAVRSIQFAPPAVTVVETGAGENREATLGDGSIVDVGAGSMLWVTLTGSSREVALERGEAFFRVAKDPARPFLVKAGTTTVAAVGTAFNVRRAGERVVVAVAEGSVKVDALAKPAPATAQSSASRPALRTARLSVGEQLSIDASDGSARIQIVDAAGIAAWRGGLMQYRDEPLRSVVSDVIRYSAQDIVIADPAIADLRVTATVFASDMESWLESLEAALPVRIVRAPGGAMRIESKPRDPSGSAPF